MFGANWACKSEPKPTRIPIGPDIYRRNRTTSSQLSAMATTSMSSINPTLLSSSSSLSTLRIPLASNFTPISSSAKTLIPNLKCLKKSSDAADGNLSSVPSLKTRLKNGETLYGIFLLTFSPTLSEIAGLAGYDFAVVDMEHGHGGISAALSCLHALAATGTAAILRLPESSATLAKKALDIGPQGIMFPMIDGPKSARKAVSYCRYPPKGIRGSAHTIIRASNYGISDEYLSRYEEDLLIMCQVESEEAAKKVDEIATVEGVDCIQMGPLDLSASMGCLWDPGNKKVKEVMHEAEKAVLKRGKARLSGFAMPHDAATELRRRGYHMVAGATDVGMFRSAAVEDVKKFKKDGMKGKMEEKEEGKDSEEKYWSE